MKGKFKALVSVILSLSCVALANPEPNPDPGAGESSCNARYKKNIVPPDCRYTDANEIWSAPTAAEWSRNSRGERSGLINIYLHINGAGGKNEADAALAKIDAALTKAQWVRTAPNSFKNDPKYLFYADLDGTMHIASKILPQPKFIGKILKGVRVSAQKGIASMPVSTEYVCGQTQVRAYEFENKVTSRHHLRIFDTGQKDKSGYNVFVIAANHDIGIALSGHDLKTAFFTHKIDPNTDNERDIVGAVFKDYGAMEQPKISLEFPCPVPADKASSKDHSALEYYLL